MRDWEGPIKAFMEKSIETHFSSSSPMQSSPVLREELVAQIRQALHHINERYVQIEPDWVDYWRKRQPNYVCTLSLCLPDEMWSPHKVSDVILEFDPALFRHTSRNNKPSTKPANLYIAYHDGETCTTISSLAEIVAFAEACEKHSQLQHAEAERRNRLHELIKQATLAYVKQVAKKERFSFILKNGYNGLALYVRLDASHKLTLNLPYEKYPDYLELIAPAIRALSGVQEHEIEFKLDKRGNSSSLALLWGNVGQE